jgi:hypothetical protein
LGYENALRKNNKADISIIAIIAKINVKLMHIAKNINKMDITLPVVASQNVEHYNGLFYVKVKNLDDKIVSYLIRLF